MSFIHCYGNNSVNGNSRNLSLHLSDPITAEKSKTYQDYPIIVNPYLPLHTYLE